MKFRASDLMLLRWARVGLGLFGSISEFLSRLWCLSGFWVFGVLGCLGLEPGLIGFQAARAHEGFWGSRVREGFWGS